MGIKENINKALDVLFAPDPPGLAAYEPKGIPGNLQRAMDNAMIAAGRKIRNGIVQAAMTGFGKGILLTAVIIAGVAILQGGLVLGTLFSAGGMMMMGIGGLLGSVMDIRQQQSKISADVAKAEAAAFETIRLQKQAERGKGMESAPDFGFAAREAAKRASVQQQMIGK